MLGILIPQIWYEFQLVAEDVELVRMLEAGTFDALIGESPEVREWAKSVVQAARSR